MGGKRNKVRYKADNKERKRITLTGQVYLKDREEDEEAIQLARKGDMMVYPCNELQSSLRQLDYYATGASGYFKVDVFEGNVWCLVLVNEIFPHREHHFSKKECPIDTYNLCAEILRGLTGKSLVRTYREHYEPEEQTTETEVPPQS